MPVEHESRSHCLSFCVDKAEAISAWMKKQPPATSTPPVASFFHNSEHCPHTGSRLCLSLFACHTLRFAPFLREKTSSRPSSRKLHGSPTRSITCHESSSLSSGCSRSTLPGQLASVASHFFHDPRERILEETRKGNAPLAEVQGLPAISHATASKGIYMFLEQPRAEDGPVAS